MTNPAVGASSPADLDWIKAEIDRLTGVHVGMLTEDESRTLATAERLKLAHRRYPGVLGLFGLSEVAAGPRPDRATGAQP